MKWSIDTLRKCGQCCGSFCAAYKMLCWYYMEINAFTIIWYFLDEILVWLEGSCYSRFLYSPMVASHDGISIDGEIELSGQRPVDSHSFHEILMQLWQNDKYGNTLCWTNKIKQVDKMIWLGNRWTRYIHKWILARKNLWELLLIRAVSVIALILCEKFCLL